MNYPRYVLFFIVLFGVVVLLLPTSFVRAEYEGLTWQGLLKVKQADLEKTKQDINALEKGVPARLATLQKDITTLESGVDGLLWMYSTHGDLPLVVRDVAVGMNKIKGEAQRKIAPLQQNLDYLKQHLQLFQTLQKHGHKQLNELKNSISEQAIADADAYLAKLTHLENRVRALDVLLSTELARPLHFLNIIDKKIPELNHTFTNQIVPFFLHRSFYFHQPEQWYDMDKALSSWVRDFSIISLEPGEYASGFWAEFAAWSIGFALVVFTLLWGTTTRLRKKLKDIAPNHHVFSVCAWLALPLGLFFAIFRAELPQSWFFSAIMTLCVNRALIHLAWILRIFNEPHRKRDSMFFAPLWYAFSVGVLFDALHLPVVLSVPIWVCVLGLVFMPYARTKKHVRGTYSPVESVLCVVYSCSVPILMLMALFGWIHLSILLATSIFIISLSGDLALGLHKLLVRITTHNDNENQEDSNTPLMDAARLLLGFPVIFMVVLFFSSSWVITSIGGFNLLSAFLELRFSVGTAYFTLARVGLIVMLFFVTRSLVALAHLGISQMGNNNPEKITQGTVLSYQTLTTYTFWLAYIMLALSLAGFTLHNLAIIAGGLSVGIGFGLKNILNNFLGGLILLCGRSIQPGDRVEINNAVGIVKKVTIRNTLLQTLAGKTLFIPNSMLISHEFINWSHLNPNFRQEITVNVSNNSDTELVTKLLLSVARTHEHVLEQPLPCVRFEHFAQSTLTFGLYYWIPDTTHMKTASDLRYEIARIFAEYGIEIPVPRQELYLQHNNPIPTES